MSSLMIYCPKDRIRSTLERVTIPQQENRKAEYFKRGIFRMEKGKTLRTKQATLHDYIVVSFSVFLTKQ